MSEREGEILRRVHAANTSLRAGQPVLVRAEDGAYLCAAAETLRDETLALIRAQSARAMIALSASRAAVLHIAPTGDDTICVPLPKDFKPTDLRQLADPTHDLDNPFRGPLKRELAKSPGAVAAAVEACKRALLLPVAVGVAWPSEAPEGVIVVEADDLGAYEEAAAHSLTRVASARVPLAAAEDARVIAFRPQDGGIEHLAIVVGEPNTEKPVLVRLHSECFTGDLLGSLKCDCGEQLQGALREIGQSGAGVLLYLAQEGRGIGLINKLRAYQLQDQGFDTIEANERLGFDADERVFRPAGEMLRQLGIRRIRLMTNNPEKVDALSGQGVEVVERVPHEFPSNAHNELYLATKAKRSGHYLSLEKAAVSSGDKREAEE